MARDYTLSSIDIGTSKITTLVATVHEEENPHIIGVSTIPSVGMRKGQVINIDEAIGAISQSLESAERMAGTSVARAFVSIGGNHIASLNSHGVVAVANPDREINQDDVRRVIDAAKAVSIPSSREVIHVLPRSYTVDSQEGIVDPAGMTGIRLEVNTHLVTAGATALKNVYKCVEELGVEVAGVVFGGMASALAVLSDTERELGVIVVDIGGGTTDVAIFIEGALSHSSVIPIGAINITRDLAAGLRVSLESAEKIKFALGEAEKKPTLPENGEVEGEGKRSKGSKDSDELDLGDLHLSEELRSISRKTLVEGIIKPRLNEIFTMVGLEIKRSGFGGMTPSGVVLTGGGAETVGAIQAARRNLAMPVHIGKIREVGGFVDEVVSPAYATSIGLLFYGIKYAKTEGGFIRGSFEKIGQRIPIRGIAGKVIDLIKSFMP